jgi:Flp pilus assembly protein TadD
LEQIQDQQSRSVPKTRLVERINAYLRAGDYSRAVDLVRTSAADFPGDAELSALEKLAEDGLKRKVDADRLITESQELFAERKFSEAIQLLRQAYELDKKNSLARSILANALVEHAQSIVETDWLESEKLTNQALALNPAHPTAKTILNRIVQQKEKSSVDDWVAQASKLQSSGDLFGALAWVAEGLAVHPHDPKLLQIQDAVQRDQEARRRQARRGDLEDLRRMQREIDGTKDVAAKQALAARIQGVAAKHWTDGEILGIANALLLRLGLVSQDSSSTSPRGKNKTLILHVPRPNAPKPASPEADQAEPTPIPPSPAPEPPVSPIPASPSPVLSGDVLPNEDSQTQVSQNQVSQNQASENPASPTQASQNQISPDQASPLPIQPEEVPTASAPVKVPPPTPPVKSRAAVESPKKVTTKPSVPQPKAAKVPASEPSSSPAQATAPLSKPKQPTKPEAKTSNATTLMIVFSAAAIILVAATFFFTRRHYAEPIANNSGATAPVSTPAVSTPAPSVPPVSAPAVSAPAEANPEPPVPVSSPSPDTSVGAVTPIDQAPPAPGRNVGTLVVVAGQDDARIFLNGKLQRQLTRAGQLRVPNLEPKDYVVQVSKDGFQDAPQQTVHIRKDEEARVVFNLQPQPHLASLTIQGGAPGTTVLVDQASVGTIQPDGTLSVSTVNPGDHTVELRKDRFKPRQFQKHFVAGAAVSLAAADTALEAAPGELKITFTPADAKVALVKGDLLKIVTSGVPLNLPAGTYTLTVRSADRITRSSSLEVIGGQSKTLDLSLAPNGMSKWDDPAGWKHEGDSFTRKGGDFVLFGVAPTSGTFVFSAMVTKGRQLQWVFNYIDSKNYVLLQLDDNNFVRTVFRNGQKAEEIIAPYKGDKKNFRTLQIRVSPTELIHEIKDGDGLRVLDRLTQPGINLTQGKFGFYIPGSDQVALSSFAHYGDLSVR